MNGAQQLVASLQQQGVDLVFGYPGGAIMPVYDALYGADLRHILVRHEQGAVFAADGYARTTGRVGVCMATSGPGATNLVTGIANAHMDSVPIVAITGQVPLPLMGTDAFQEVDTIGITMPICKHSFLVESADDMAGVVEEAFRIASSGRPGPVVIDLPKDVANAPVSGDVPGAGRIELPPPPAEHNLAAARDLLQSARRPVVYAGGGVGLGRAVDALRAFTEEARVPVVSTLKGLGVLPRNHELFLGMIGMHGSKAANLAVQECDLLICAGARFDDRATGKLDRFAPHAKVVHLDVDPSEVGKLRRADVRVLGDMRVALSGMSTSLEIDPWRETCKAMRERDDAAFQTPPGGRVHGPTLLRELSRARPEAVVACDVGQHQMWVAQHWQISRPDRHLTSGGLGAMGYGLPAGIGAALAGCPDVVVVSGDGSFMMNVQELATVRRYGLPLKIIVLDNSALGMVRQWQELFFDGRYSEIDLSDNPDFAEVARAFGIPGMRLEGPDAIARGVQVLAETEGPLLLHVPIDPGTGVWPLVPPGRSNAEMMEENQP